MLVGRRALLAAASAPSSTRHSLAPAAFPRQPHLALFARTLCSSGPTDEQKAEVLEFLRAASRPIMGKAKAKTTAGQKALDLTKQAGRLEDVDITGLLRLTTEDLRERGVPCQERKRILNYTDKYLQGFRHDGRPGKHAWKGWVAPYRQPGHPSNEPGHQPYWLDPNEKVTG